MQFADIKFTQAIHGFQAGKVETYKCLDWREVRIPVRREAFQCPGCGSGGVAAYPERVRRVMGVPVGRCRCALLATVHRLRCAGCGFRGYERLPFLSSPAARVTRQLERTVVGLRSEMSITAVARFCGLDWKTARDIEKGALGRKYARVRLKDVRRIAIDEIYAF